MIELAGYTITDLLSQNRSTTIYRGARLTDGAPVILKVLDAEFPTPLQVARIQHEFELLNKFDHPGIIRTLGLEKAHHSLAIVLEDFGGAPLRRLIEQNDISLLDKLRIARRIGEILGDIHRRNIVHKDINPNNILIHPETGRIKVIDFGNATEIVHEERQLKRPEQLEGTLAYIAPEQTGRMNRPVDYRSDFYSLGITLYELFLGRRPFDAQDSMEMVHLHLASVPADLHSQNPDIPPAIADIVKKLVEKNAENRYQSAAGLCRDLDICLDALSKGSQPADFKAGQHDISDKFSIPAKLYGRAEEVRHLLEAFERTASGDSGIVLVTGHSGIGKSSLINEIHKPITQKRGFFIEGKFDQFRRNIPYSALIQAFQGMLRQILAGSDVQIAEWRKRLLAALGENAQVIIDVLPELRPILGAQPAVPLLSPHEAQNRFNFYLINFVRVFAQAEHPLVLFLDDLQWADHPSLGILELLGADRECRHLLVIGAYRQNEVDSGHSLQLSLDRLRKDGAHIEEIALNALPNETVCRIVADAVHSAEAYAAPLADLIYRKTGGNPFFVNQLLKSLHEKELIHYDHARHRWDWDIAQIEQIGFTDNVVDLMTENIRKLPHSTQQLLKLAACIGNRFSLQDLSVVAENTRDAIAADFLVALKAELLVPIGEEFKFFGHRADQAVSASLDVHYRFQHDRVQQAAYDLLNPDEKVATHFKVGVLLLENTPEEALDDKLFDIVNHFNQALDLVSDPALIRRLIDLNIRAASKAKHAIAYEPALEYIKTAQKLVAPQPERPEYLFRILLERAECEHLNGQQDSAEKHYHQALKKAANPNDHAAVLEAMIHFYTNTGNFALAYQTGRQALKLFGVSLPSGFIPPLFAADLVRLKWRMRGKAIADLIDLPLCTDEKLRTAMRLIGALLKAAYQIRPELCIANAVKAVNLSLEHGTMEDNAVAYLVFGGIFVGGVLGRHQAGYEFGQLAWSMNQRFNNLKQRSEINFVSGYFTHFWLKPASETETYYRAAYESGLQTGDFFHLSCAACTLIESQLIRGAPLPEIKRQAENHLAFMERIKSHEAAGALTATLRTILNLEGMTTNPESFGSPDFNEADFVARLRSFSSLHFSHFYFVNKMQTLYLWRRFKEALHAARESEAFLKYSLAMLHTTEHHFYHALILCACYERDPQKKYLNQAWKILKKFEQWAELNPANFEHKALLIRAEIERLTRDDCEVAGLYAKAIQSADTNGFQQNKALANELAGRFFADREIGMSARGHIREAYYTYRLWGATGIADRLAHEFPQYIALRGQDTRLQTDQAIRTVREDSFPPASQLQGSVPRSVTSGTTGTHHPTNLDLETVIKATQAISSEIKLSALLQKMMRIMMENAGAERGSLVWVDQGTLATQACGTATGEIEILDSAPLDSAKQPVSVIQYVARLGESVVLNDAETDARFWDDPYIAQTKPKSLLCTPIVHQGKIVGVVSLENNLVSGAFTPDRLEILGILAAQSAISIENSHLYANLEERVQERTLELSKLTEKLKEANEALEKLTFTDPLTQVSNKRHFQQVYEEEWKRASRAGTPLTLMLIDVDCFKLYNDTYGHIEGDNCLKAVASALDKGISRAGDLVARFGGEEFIIILPNTPLDDACTIASRLVENVRNLNIPHKTSVAAPIVTISLGVAQSIPQQGADPTSLITAADQALYHAKTSGRNRHHAQRNPD
jgi:diguanylate cyclase (GGDEF)-like protein